MLSLSNVLPFSFVDGKIQHQVSRRASADASLTNHLAGIQLRALGSRLLDPQEIVLKFQIAVFGGPEIQRNCCQFIYHGHGVPVLG